MAKLKNKKPDAQVEELQKIYESGKLKTDEGFRHVSRIIKTLLMKYLINSKAGYYKEGVKQTCYDEEDWLDCYTYVMDRVYGTYTYKLGKKGRVIYDPTRMNLASFIHTWVRGHSSDKIKKQQRRYKKNFHRTIYLEDILENSKTPNSYRGYFDIEEIDINIELDKIFNTLDEDNCIDVVSELNENFYIFKKYVDGELSLKFLNKFNKI